MGNILIKYDIDLESITAIRYLGYIIFAFATTRNIIKKHYEEGYKIIEYIACAVLYLSAITAYTSEFDGMIFVLLLAIITIFSYNKKYGPIFLSSIITIIANGLLLTREFWFSIPWWIYMLVIGSILIAFAVKNEVSEKANKGGIKDKFNKIKENIDL